MFRREEFSSERFCVRALVLCEIGTANIATDRTISCTRYTAAVTWFSEIKVRGYAG